jgi:hypothetical protein
MVCTGKFGPDNQPVNAGRECAPLEPFLVRGPAEELDSLIDGPDEVLPDGARLSSLIHFERYALSPLGEQ